MESFFTKEGNKVSYPSFSDELAYEIGQNIYLMKRRKMKIVGALYWETVPIRYKNIPEFVRLEMEKSLTDREKEKIASLENGLKESKELLIQQRRREKKEKR